MLSELWIEYFMFATPTTQITFLLWLFITSVLCFVINSLYDNHKEKQEFRQFVEDYFNGTLNYAGQRGNN